MFCRVLHSYVETKIQAFNALIEVKNDDKSKCWKYSVTKLVDVQSNDTKYFLYNCENQHTYTVLLYKELETCSCPAFKHHPNECKHVACIKKLLERGKL